MTVAAHGVTHPGRRSTNEDSLLIDLARGLFVVADGMGGHNAGEIASDLAVCTIGRVITRGGSPMNVLLSEAVGRANTDILTAAAEEPDYAGMGTTVVAAVVSNGRALFTSVGDSRIYLWTGSQLVQLTHDDSWVARVLPESGLSPADIQQHPMRHVLTRVVGLRADLQPSVQETELGEGDALLLCTDGLHGALSLEDMVAVFAAGGSVHDIAERLVAEAVERGATDNVTAIVVRREP